MKSILFRVFASILLACGIVSTYASASELSDAFASISYSNGVDTFNTEVRTGITFGSGAIRFGGRAQNLRPNTVSFTPPSISASCNGVSWHFGGFSFVNGDEIIQAIEAALPAAAMYVLGIVVSGLCEQCWTGLQQVLDTVNKVTNALRNSCDLGAALAESSGLANKARSVREDICSLGKAESGSSTDRAASAKACQQSAVTNTYFEDLLNTIKNSSSQGPDQVAAANSTLEEQCPLVGNATWCALNKLGVVVSLPQCTTVTGSLQCTYEVNRDAVWGEMFQSIVGATYSATDTIAGNARSATVKDLIEYLMCGTNSSRTTEPQNLSDPLEATVASHCWQMLHPKSQTGAPTTVTERDFPTIIACGPDQTVPSQDTFKACSPTYTVPIDTWLQRSDVQAVLGQGFLYHTTAALYAIINKMKTGQALDDSEKKFIQSAPFPLYRLLNLASLFPHVENDLVKKNAVAISYMMAHEMINEKLRSGQRRSIAFRGANPKVLDALNALAKQIQMDNDKFLIELDETNRRSRLFTDFVERLHNDMLRVIYDKQLKSNYMAAADLARLTTPTYR